MSQARGTTAPTWRCGKCAEPVTTAVPREGPKWCGPCLRASGRKLDSSDRGVDAIVGRRTR